MPGGFILVKNDADFLYLALDLVNDNGNSPGVGDYFWLSFDVDRSGSITPNFDINYGIYPTLPIKIGKQFYLGARHLDGNPAHPQSGSGSTRLLCYYLFARST